MTHPRPAITFPPYRLDVDDGCLWRGDKRITLSATDGALLAYLASRPGRLLTHEELLAALWPGVAVTQGLLKVRVRRLRRVLGDRTDRPRFIETVYGRGYRFVAAVTGHPARAHPRARTNDHGPESVARNFVGRDAELDLLRHYLEHSRGGERQIVFVAGEPGIGKSALVSEFLARTVDAARVCLGQGQCLETHGAVEAYMPVLEALGRACRGPGGRRLQRRLRTLAPSWLAQMPALLTARQARALRREGAATHERMVRELAEALDVVTFDRPMVLWLEDVHWSDVSSLTLLSALAQRPDPARLLIVATYRPADALASNQALMDLVRELDAHGRCRSLDLGRLGAEHVVAYLGARFPGHAFPAPLAAVLHQRTEGHPLFLVSAVHDLVAAGNLAEVAGHWTLKTEVDALNHAVPATIRHLVGRQRERLSPAEQAVLAAASLAGAVFAVPLVAAALECPIADVEDACARLAERQLFVRPGAVVHWPDGTAAATYAFLHAVHQALWQERVGVSTRQAWHLRIAERLEGAHGDHARAIAAELAMHFEAAGSFEKAIRYLRLASANAMRRSAPHEAILLARHGLALLGRAIDAGVRAELERDLRLALGRVQIMTGYAGPEDLENYARLRELCRDAPDDRGLLVALVPLARFQANRAEFETARELGARALRIAQTSPDRFLASALALLGGVEFHRGELTTARLHLERALSLHDLRRSETPGLESIEVPALGHRAVVLWHLGCPQQALEGSRAAVTAARRLGLPVSIAFALSLAAWVHRLRREPEATRALAAELVALATEYGFSVSVAQGTFELGWALAAEGRVDEGRARMRDGLERYAATGACLYRVGNVIAEIDAAAEESHGADTLATITELLATVERTGQRYHEPTLYRLKGELLLHAADDSAAEACFQRAIDVAARQGARLPELQATVSLARLRRRQGKAHEARALLAPIHGWFTEGFDTADLGEAKELLETL